MRGYATEQETLICRLCSREAKNILIAVSLSQEQDLQLSVSTRNRVYSSLSLVSRFLSLIEKEQRQAVAHLLDSKDVVVVLPTGFGRMTSAKLQPAIIFTGRDVRFFPPKFSNFRAEELL